MVVSSGEVGHFDLYARIIKKVETPALRCGIHSTASNQLNKFKENEASRDVQVSTATIGCRAVVKVGST